MVQANNYEQQQKALKVQATSLMDQGGYEAGRQDDRNRRLTGQQITATAASGVDLSGSPLDVIADSRSEGELDKAAIRYNAQIRSNQAQYEAKVAGQNAQQVETGAMIGAIAPIIGGSTSLRTSFG
jgi:hypothetical protein